MDTGQHPIPLPYMSQKTSGIYKLLSNPYFYLFSQKVMFATSFRKNLIKKMIKKKNVKVLDIGCGPGNILESLPKSEYFGYDINSSYINYAKKKYGKGGKFFCKKFSKHDLKKLPKFDHVLLLGILHHMNDKEVNRLILLIKKVLKKNGKLITLDGVFINNQNPIAKFLLKMDRGQHIRSKNKYLSILKKKFKKIQAKIYHNSFIPYTLIAMNCKN